MGTPAGNRSLTVPGILRPPRAVRTGVLSHFTLLNKYIQSWPRLLGSLARLKRFVTMNLLPLA